MRLVARVAIEIMITLWWTIAVAILLFAFCPRARAFPENVRQGYPTCGACHLAGTGGGILTLYGREKAQSSLSTFAHEEPLDEYPESVLVGGDFRYLSYDYDGRHRDFIMVARASLAINPLEPLWFVATAGQYGEASQLEYREMYARADVFGDLLSIRAGRFMPVYGIGFDDHTLASRRLLGFGDGGERYAVEASTRTGVAELALTQSFGANGRLAMANGFTYSTYDETASIARASVYPTDRMQFGLSGLYAIGQASERRSYGGFAMYSPADWSYIMADINRINPGPIVATTIMGVEPYRGLTIAATHEQVDSDSSYGLLFKLYPHPHIGLIARVKERYSLLMVHLWI